MRCWWWNNTGEALSCWFTLKEPLTHTKAAVRNMSCDPFNQLHFTNDVKPALATLHRQLCTEMLVWAWFSHFLTRQDQGTLHVWTIQLCTQLIGNILVISMSLEILLRMPILQKNKSNDKKSTFKWLTCIDSHLFYSWMNKYFKWTDWVNNSVAHS